MNGIEKKMRQRCRTPVSLRNMVPRWRFLSIWLGLRWAKNIQRQKKASILAISVIGVGIMTILIGLSTGNGLQTEIEKKIERFHGTYQIRPYQTRLEGNLLPFSTTELSLDSSDFFEFIDTEFDYHLTSWKMGIVTFSDQMEGGRLFGFKSIPKSILSVPFQGKVPNWSKSPNSVWISDEMARKLGTTIGDEIQMHFSRGNRLSPSIRYLKVSGIFESSISEWEDPLIICSIEIIQRLNKWEANQTQSILLYQKNNTPLNEEIELNKFLPIEFQTFSSEDDFPQFYQWIKLFDNNTYLLGVILIIVASFNSVIVIFIRIIEKKSSVAILRAIGMRKSELYTAFMSLFSQSILIGLVLGNFLAFIFLFSQSKFKWLPLDPKTYYISTVPISWPWIDFLIANLLIFTALTVTTWVTSIILSKIHPSRVLQSQ